jgi:PD-(D/E)XK nuclease superfamily
MLYAHMRSGALKGPAATPLVRGSIGHVGLAQLYSRLKAVQERRDPDAYLDPLSAMERVADGYGESGRSLLPIVVPIIRDYAERHPFERFRVVEVEAVHETRLSGHLYTARLDLTVEDEAGKVWVYDHKIVSQLQAKTFDRYTLSGQFMGQALLAREAWGSRFAGVVLNVLAVGSHFARQKIEAAPWMSARFPEVVRVAEERIAQIEADLAAGRFPGAAPTEMTCFTPYGPCVAFDFCRWGPEEVEEEMSDTPLTGSAGGE